MNTFIIGLSSLVIICSLVPLIRHEYWVFRVFDFPRLQKLILALLCMVLLLTVFNGAAAVRWALAALLTANVAYMFCQIIPFTPLGRKQLKGAKTVDRDNRIRIFTGNVYQDNRNTAGCLSEIFKANPDVILLLETNNWWDESTRQLADDYPHHVNIPLENTYGMLLYSRLPLSDTVVKHLVEPDIPSIHTIVTLPNGQPVQLYAIHPTPPVPNENPRSTERDMELLLVADLVQESRLPTIVIGDLNDVAWSYTTTLFLKMSGLLDPRRGRGFFNTFHAHYPFMRFPLDHAFVSEHFNYCLMKRVANFGSDHFPILVELQYAPQAKHEQADEAFEATPEDHEAAEEKKNADLNTP